MKKVFSFGAVLHKNLYERLQKLDAIAFYECGNEFKENREWWVMVDKGQIVAYCGCLFTDKICIFVRAWVHEPYRGKGIQKRMIDVRIKAAKRNKCKTAITYTFVNNLPSANSLINRGFKLYEPEYKWGGREMLYWKRLL